MAITTRPPGRPSKEGSLRRGAKYELVRKALRVEPIDWIIKRREPTYKRPDGSRSRLSFRELADEISRRMTKAGINDYVTIETVRSWYRAVHPTDGPE